MGRIKASDVANIDMIGDIASKFYNTGRIETISSYDLGLLVEDHWDTWETKKQSIPKNTIEAEIYDFWGNLLLERFGI